MKISRTCEGAAYFYAQESRFSRTATYGSGSLSSSARSSSVSYLSPARPTTTLHTAYRPLGERAVIFASPSATAVTTPLASTVATPGLLVTQVMGTLPPLSTATVAHRAS